MKTHVVTAISFMVAAVQAYAVGHRVEAKTNLVLAKEWIEKAIEAL